MAGADSGVLLAEGHTRLSAGRGGRPAAHRPQDARLNATERAGGRLPFIEPSRRFPLFRFANRRHGCPTLHADVPPDVGASPGGAKELYVDDDTFLKNPRWVTDFCERYSSEVGVPFYCNARPETVRLDLCRRLKAAGCMAIGIGIESGNERIRREVLSRGMSNDRIVRAFQLAHEAGLKTWSFNMVGIPGETLSDFMDTVTLNDRVRTDYVRFLAGLFIGL